MDGKLGFEKIFVTMGYESFLGGLRAKGIPDVYIDFLRVLY